MCLLMLLINYMAGFKQYLKKKNCIFHNAKFDINYLEYELNFTFPDWEDTMLLHYCLEEAVGTHGLKTS